MVKPRTACGLTPIHAASCLVQPASNNVPKPQHTGDELTSQCDPPRHQRPQTHTRTAAPCAAGCVPSAAHVGPPPALPRRCMRAARVQQMMGLPCPQEQYRAGHALRLQCQALRVGQNRRSIAGLLCMPHTPRPSCMRASYASVGFRGACRPGGQHPGCEKHPNMGRHQALQPNSEVASHAARASHKACGATKFKKRLPAPATAGPAANVDGCQNPPSSALLSLCAAAAHTPALPSNTPSPPCRARRA